MIITKVDPLCTPDNSGPIGCGCNSNYAKTSHENCVLKTDCLIYSFARECFDSDNNPTDALIPKRDLTPGSQLEFQCVEHQICSNGYLVQWTCPPGMAFLNDANPILRKCSHPSDVPGTLSTVASFACPSFDSGPKSTFLDISIYIEFSFAFSGIKISSNIEMLGKSSKNT